MVSCNQSTLLAIRIGYLLIREHKEVDPLFSSSPFSSRSFQGLYSYHCLTIYLRSSLLSVTVRVEVSGRDGSVILLSYMIAYLLLREHKEVDLVLFSSFFFQVVPGTPFPTFFHHPRKVFPVVGVGNCFILAVISVKSCQYP